MKTLQKIQNVTSKGQITLPVLWRNLTKARQVQVKISGEKVEITPVHLNKKTKKIHEYTVFDAIRDNNGKGINAKDLLNILKRINK